jgi:hypothetical protein
MSDNSSANPLTVQEVKQIIRRAQSGGSDLGTLVFQIFSGLAPIASVSGDVLRQALLECSISLGEPFAAILGGVNEIEKNHTNILLTRPAVAEVNVSDTRLRMLPDLRFNVGTLGGAPALTNITGLSAQKLFWIDTASATLTIQCLEHPFWASCGAVNGRVHDLVEAS